MQVKKYFKIDQSKLSKKGQDRKQGKLQPDKLQGKRHITAEKVMLRD